MASALEHFVNNVRTMTSQGNFSQLCEFLNSSHEVLSRNFAHLDNVLATLELQHHSLGIMAVLIVKYSAPNQQDEESLDVQVEEFVRSCNGEQIRFAPDIYSELCHLYTQKLMERRTPMRGIELLSKAIQRIRLCDTQLTSLHADLCQLCLLAQCFKPALPFLDVDITDISKENNAFDAKHLLLYYYYGGMIYAALKNYERGLYFFEVVVTTPAMAVSHIMLEAYKKYVVISLILHGKVQNLPRCTSLVVNRFIKPLSQPYHDLANAYVTNDPDLVRAVINKSQETFARDKNMGLVKQCLSSLTRKNIQRLTKTFLTLSLCDVASRVKLSGPKEAERDILNMIEDGEIYATINQRDGMVVFHDNPEQYNSPEMQRKIDIEMTLCMDLEKRLQKLEESITTNPQYVQKASGSQDDEAPGSSTSSSVKLPAHLM